jgi:hypothetical protein
VFILGVDMHRDMTIRADIEQSLALWKDSGEERLLAENRKLAAEAPGPRSEIGAAFHKALQDQKRAVEQTEAAEQASRQAAVAFHREVRDGFVQIDKELTETREDILVNESVSRTRIDHLQEQMDLLSGLLTGLKTITYACVDWQRERVDWLNSRVTWLMDRLTPRSASA